MVLVIIYFFVHDYTQIIGILCFVDVTAFCPAEIGLVRDSGVIGFCLLSLLCLFYSFSRYYGMGMFF